MSLGTQRKIYKSWSQFILLKFVTSDAFQLKAASLSSTSLSLISHKNRKISNLFATQSQKEYEIKDILDSSISLERIAGVQNSAEFQNDKEDKVTDFLDPSIAKKRIVEIQASVELPFSAEIAYDAYSNLPRQSDWSSWLHKVEYLENSTERSKWTLKILGFKFSWYALALKNDRPHVIQWKSTSGLANFGTVTFKQKDDEQTTMILKMTLVAPRAVAALFRKTKGLQNFVEKKMILTSLHKFREIVMETDVK